MSITLGSTAISSINFGADVVNSIYEGTTLVWDNNFTATGGDIVGTYTSGSKTYKYHQFNNGGNFVVSSGGKNNVEVLVVGGGAGGGTSQGYPLTLEAIGGGAGGVLVSNLGTLTVLPGTYPVYVGAGGIGGYKVGSPGTRYNGTNGVTSSFKNATLGINLIASGGFTTLGTGDDGYSGQPTRHAPGSVDGVDATAGGGGGAGVAGANGSSSGPGAGGDGIQNDFNGTWTYYGGGGGGGSTAYSNVYPQAPGGLGGGGLGGNQTSQAGDASPNTGGGGGGEGPSGTNTLSGAGGSGIVIVRYEIPFVPTTTTTTGAPTTTTTSTTSTTTTTTSTTTTTTTTQPPQQAGYTYYTVRSIVDASIPQWTIRALNTVTSSFTAGTYLYCANAQYASASFAGRQQAPLSTRLISGSAGQPYCSFGLAGAIVGFSSGGFFTDEWVGVTGTGVSYTNNTVYGTGVESSYRGFILRDRTKFTQAFNNWGNQPWNGKCATYNGAAVSHAYISCSVGTPTTGSSAETVCAYDYQYNFASGTSTALVITGYYTGSCGTH